MKVIVLLASLFSLSSYAEINQESIKREIEAYVDTYESIEESLLKGPKSVKSIVTAFSNRTGKTGTKAGLVKACLRDLKCKPILALAVLEQSFFLKDSMASIKVLKY